MAVRQLFMSDTQGILAGPHDRRAAHTIEIKASHQQYVNAKLEL